MAKIIYLIGDATNPQVPGPKIICHVCNNIGAWGAGFVLALSKKWKQPEQSYRAITNYVLGEVDLVQVEEDILVANMIGQEGIGFAKDGQPPIRYSAVRNALEKVAVLAAFSDASIHMPRIGCGLAGGKWEEIEKIIQHIFGKADIKIYVYDLK